MHLLLFQILAELKMHHALTANVDGSLPSPLEKPLFKSFSSVEINPRINILIDENCIPDPYKCSQKLTGQVLTLVSILESQS